MKKICISLSLLFIANSAFAKFNFEPTQYKCSGIELRIERINSKMRAGYTAREGERLKEELRTLKKQRYACKKKGLSVS